MAQKFKKEIGMSVSGYIRCISQNSVLVPEKPCECLNVGLFWHLGYNFGICSKSQRVECAKTLLRSTNRSIAEIAEELGYCNASYLNEAFKSVESMTTSAFRVTWGK
jgi:YesN/AraC family two-component response regulator